MPEYMDPFPSTVDLFDKALDEVDLKNYINVAIISDNKAKKVFDVKKVTPLNKHLSDYDVIIVLNEVVFDKLTDEQRTIVIEDALSRISFSDEKLAIARPDVTVNRLIITKFGADKYLDLHDTITLIYAQEKDKKAQDDKK